jgi:hypothetical protein
LWGKLTDDDLAFINGRRDQLEGKIQERYAAARDQARKDIEDCTVPKRGIELITPQEAPATCRGFG